MLTRNLCLICIYIFRNCACQISNEASFLAFHQPVANRLKFFLPSSRRLSKISSVYSFNNRAQCLWSKIQWLCPFTFTLITILSLHLNTAGLNENDIFVVSLLLSFSLMGQLPMSLTSFYNFRLRFKIIGTVYWV